MEERYRLFLFRHLFDRGARHRGGIGIAEHLHVSADRDQAELPARAGAVGPAEQLRAETDGENLDFDAIAPGREIVPQLMYENQDREDDQKWKDLAFDEGKAVGEPSHRSMSPSQSPAAGQTLPANAAGSLSKL